MDSRFPEADHPSTRPLSRLHYGFRRQSPDQLPEEVQTRRSRRKERAVHARCTPLVLLIPTSFPRYPIPPSYSRYVDKTRPSFLSQYCQTVCAEAYLFRACECLDELAIDKLNDRFASCDPCNAEQSRCRRTFYRGFVTSISGQRCREMCRPECK